MVAQEEETVQLNFVNTPIENLTMLISELTGNNFVSEQEVKGNFTFVSQKPIKRSNLMAIYEMILRTKGYMIVNHEDKGFFMITKNSQPQRENIEFGVGKENYEVQTEVINLKYFTPSKINPIISPYFTPAGKIVSNDELGFIMITDYYDNIKKVKDIVEKIDIPSTMNVNWVKLNNVNIKNVFPQITKLAESQSKKYRKTVQVLDDKSSNSVILMSEGDEYKELEDLIKRLDDEAKLNIKSQVVYLKNSKAEEIMKIITTISTNRYKNGEIKETEQVSISHDTSLNAIILMGERNAVQEYIGIIDELDKPKKQVYVEARVVEISESKTKEIGVNLDDFLLGNAASGGAWSILGSTTATGGAPALTTLNKMSTVTVSEGVTKSALQTVEGGLSVGATLKFLEANGALNVLSSPKLLCIDNQESSIYVGQVAPFRTSESQQTTTTTVPVTSYAYKDVGLTLKIKPQIMGDNKVRLDITNKLEEIAENSDKTLPTTTKREISTTSIVDDGNDVVIAGLIKDKENLSEQKVPLLGDIPLLGALFSSTYTKKEKVNLIVIVTPRVVTDVTKLSEISNGVKNRLISDEKYRPMVDGNTTKDGNTTAPITSTNIAPIDGKL